MTTRSLPAELTDTRLRYLIVKHLNRYRARLKFAQEKSQRQAEIECERLLQLWMMVDFRGGTLNPVRYNPEELQEINEAYNDEDWSTPDRTLITTDMLLRNYRGSLSEAVSVNRQGARQHAEQNGRAIACEMGCAYCCYQKILVGASEGLAIYDELKQSGRWTPELQAKLKEADRVMTDNDHAVFFDLKIPCAFLEEESPGRGKCTAYNSRPIACSSTYSIGSDPKNCDWLDERGANEGQFQIFASSPMVLGFFSAHQHLQHGMEGSDQLMLMTLPGAVLWAAAHQEEQPRPVVRRVPYKMEGMGEAIDEFDSAAIHRRSP